jgi:SAM-dependent methyltransferase
MNPNLTTPPTTDPTPLLQYRDGLYATDLLAAAISHLDFFTWLRDHPSGIEAIQSHFNFKSRPTDVLLTLCAANQFIIKHDDGTFHTTPTANEHLCSDSPFFLGPYYDSLKDRPITLDFLKVLRSGKPATWGSFDEDESDDWHKAMLTEDFARDFTAAMDCRGLALGQALAAALTSQLANHSHILDIGAGSGIYANTLVAAHSHLSATVLEQAPVDTIAARAIKSHGLTDRVTVASADMFHDPWPTHADVHLLSNVLHDWDFPEVEKLIAKSAQTLPSGGLLIIHEAFLNDTKTGPLPVAEYSTILMHSTQGKCYAPAEYRPLLEKYGLTPGPYQDTLANRGYLTATKP